VGQSDIWYVYEEGKQFGPLSEREVIYLVAYGRVQPTSLVWRPGFATWSRAQDVEGLYKPPPVPDPNPVNGAGPVGTGRDASDAGRADGPAGVGRSRNEAVR
jgi:hypothetical protein